MTKPQLIFTVMKYTFQSLEESQIIFMSLNQKFDA